MPPLTRFSMPSRTTDRPRGCRLSQSVGAHGQWEWSKNSSWKKSTRSEGSSSSRLRRAPASSIDSSTRKCPTSSRSVPTGCRLAAPGSAVAATHVRRTGHSRDLFRGRRFRIVDTRLPVSVPSDRKARTGGRPRSTDRRRGLRDRCRRYRTRRRPRRHRHGLLDGNGFQAQGQCDVRVDLPLLELLRGVSVNSLADRILADLHLTGARPGCGHRRGTEAADDDVDRLIEELSETELREVLAELEKPQARHTREFRGAGPRFVQVLWAAAGRAGRGPRCRIRRGIRDSRAQRGRQVDDHRDPRGSSKA